MIRINLLREPSVKRNLWSVDGSKTGIIGVILLVVALGSMGWWYLRTVQERADCQVQVQKLQQEDAKLKAAQAELKRYETLKKKLDDRIALIEQLKANQKGPVNLMNAVIASLPSPPRVWLSSLTQKDTLVSMEGQSLDVPAIADFIANLNSHPPFRQVELDFWEEDTGGIKFKLTCEVVNGPVTD